MPKENEIYFETEHIVNGRGLFDFDPVFQMTNDLKYMTQVAADAEFGVEYDQYRKDFVKARVQAVQYLQKLKENRASNKKEVGKVGKEGFPMEYRNQTQLGGCWSVGIEDLLSSRGVKLPQEIVRSYRGNVDVNSAGFKDSVNKMNAESIAEFAGVGTDLLFRTSVITEVMPNVAVRTKVYDYSKISADEMKSKIGENLNKAFTEKNSPVSLNYGGHYVTIHKYDAETGKVWYKEPMNPPSKNPVATTVQGLAKMCLNKEGGTSCSMTWLEDLDFNQNKTIEGFENYQYKNNELDGSPNEKVKLVNDPRIASGKLLRKEDIIDDDLEKGIFNMETTTLHLPDKLVELQPYQSIEPPAIIGVKAKCWTTKEGLEIGMEEIRARERQEREQHWKEAKPNPVVPAIESCVNAMREKNTSASKTMKALFADFDNMKKYALPAKKKYLEGIFRNAQKYLEEKQKLSSLSATQKMRLENVQALLTIRDMVSGNVKISPASPEGKRRIGAARIACGLQTEKNNIAAACNHDLIKDSAQTLIDRRIIDRAVARKQSGAKTGAEPVSTATAAEKKGEAVHTAPEQKLIGILRERMMKNSRAGSQMKDLLAVMQEAETGKLNQQDAMADIGFHAERYMGVKATQSSLSSTQKLRLECVQTLFAMEDMRKANIDLNSPEGMQKLLACKLIAAKADKRMLCDRNAFRDACTKLINGGQLEKYAGKFTSPEQILKSTAKQLETAGKPKQLAPKDKTKPVKTM